MLSVLSNQKKKLAEYYLYYQETDTKLAYSPPVLVLFFKENLFSGYNRLFFQL